MKSSPAPPALSEARTANRLADALLVVAAEYAEEHRLSQGCVFAALTISLGRLTGGAARDDGTVLGQLLDEVKRHVERVARLEFNRPAWRLS